MHILSASAFLIGARCYGALRREGDAVAMDDVDTARTTGENIRKLREAKGLSQDALADICNLTKITIHRAETAASSKNGIGIHTLVKIADGLEATPNDLLAGTFVYGVDAKQVELLKLFRQMSPEQQNIILATSRQFAPSGR